VQSSSVSRLGYLTTRSVSAYSGGSVVTSTVPQTVSHREIVVANGNVQGNKRDPNPFKFTKLVGMGKNHLNGSESYLLGEPAWQQQTGVAYSGPRLLTPRLSPDFGRTRDRALEKVYDQIRGNSNLVIDMAESAATIKMLRGTLNFRRLGSDFFRSMIKTGPKGRGPSGGQKRLDYVTGKWLEGRYGWQPLMHSIYDAMDTLSRQVIELNPTVKGRSGAKNEAVYTSGSGTYASPRETTKVDLSYRTEYGIQFQLRPGTQIWDWTSLNPLAIAWELTPLSFVGDWFINVSQQLNLLENYWLFSSMFRKGYRTDSFKHFADTEISGLTTSYPISRWPSGSPFDQTYLRYYRSGHTELLTSKDRVVLDSLPLPSGVRLSVNVGAKRQLDAAALVHQLFAKRTRF
jgi:hypothetical protein